MNLADWFRYKNRNEEPYNPTVEAFITTDRFMHAERGDFESHDWRAEEWLIRSALIAPSARKRAMVRLDPHDLAPEFGWDSDGSFNFGERHKSRRVNLYRWCFTRSHLVTGELVVELREDFLRYHALDKKNSDLVPPLENAVAATIQTEKHHLFHTSPFVRVYIDYLRDYLAAQKRGMLISVVADRFATAKTKEALGLKIVENEKQADGSWITTTIHGPASTQTGYYRGRSTLRKNYWIDPYERPRWERGTWYFYGELPYTTDDLPYFIVNAEGQRARLDRHWIGYLHFRREVLEKYLSSRGYTVYFHMRNWGCASPPGHAHSIDVGINSRGLVNAFAPDLAKQTPAEQAYWASFSTLPYGEVCEEMFETRMQQNPPHAPNVVEVIDMAKQELHVIFKNRFRSELFKPSVVKNRELARLTVGPLREDTDEFCRLCKILYSLNVECIDISALRQALQSLGASVDTQQRQIALMTALVGGVLGDDDKARRTTDPLRALNKLRVADAHLGEADLAEALKLLGETAPPPTVRDAWGSCVESIARTFHSLATALAP